MLAQAQKEELEYRPFAEEGKIWSTTIGGLNQYVYDGYFAGDTIIGGETWQKVYTIAGINRVYYAAVRDEGKKVYAIAKGSSRPRLLYDFSLKEGDFVRCGVEGSAFECLRMKEEPLDTLHGFLFNLALKVDRIDTIKLRDGLEHRRFTLSMWSPGKDILIATPIVWIEGLGSGAGPFSPWMLQSPLLPTFNEHRAFVTYWGNENLSPQIIAISDEFYELESSTAVSSLQPTQEKGTFYDLDGRQISTKPSRGIYIEDGKKRMVK
jgi:hypothetical protein